MAARYLCTHDYTILARNYRTPFGEVDLIAQKDGVLVYVEVKYRSSNDYGDPLEAVDRRKPVSYTHLTLPTKLEV